MNRLTRSLLRRPSRPRPAAGFLLVWTCRHCCSDAVAIGASSDGFGCRTYELRCGDCGSWRRLAMPHALAARFEASLQAHRAVIARTAEQLARHRIDAELSLLRST